MDSSAASEYAVLPQQSSRSCTECSRRKLKCSRTIPCSACIKRGQAFACVAPDKKKALGDPDPKALLDERRAAALSEVQLMRSTLASLQARLPNFEAFIAASGPSNDDPQSSSDLNAILRNFGNPVTALRHSNDIDGRDYPGNLFEAGPPPKRVKRNSAAVNEEQEESAAVEASVSLEFAVSPSFLSQSLVPSLRAFLTFTLIQSLGTQALGRPRLHADNQERATTSPSDPTVSRVEASYQQTSS